MNLSYIVPIRGGNIIFDVIKAFDCSNFDCVITKNQSPRDNYSLKKYVLGTVN